MLFITTSFVGYLALSRGIKKLRELKRRRFKRQKSDITTEERFCVNDLQCALADGNELHMVPLYRKEGNKDIFKRLYVSAQLYRFLSMMPTKEIEDLGVFVEESILEEYERNDIKARFGQFNFLICTEKDYTECDVPKLLKHLFSGKMSNLLFRVYVGEIKSVPQFQYEISLHDILHVSKQKMCVQGRNLMEEYQCMPTLVQARNSMFDNPCRSYDRGIYSTVAECCTTDSVFERDRSAISIDESKTPETSQLSVRLRQRDMTRFIETESFETEPRANSINSQEGLSSSSWTFTTTNSSIESRDSYTSYSTNQSNASEIETLNQDSDASTVKSA